VACRESATWRAESSLVSLIMIRRRFDIVYRNQNNLLLSGQVYDFKTFSSFVVISSLIPLSVGPSIDNRKKKFTLAVLPKKMVRPEQGYTVKKG
jgi:hypothetical protein